MKDNNEIKINDELIQMLRDDPETARAVLLSDFSLFIKVFHYYTTRKQFKFKPFHYKIIRTLEKYAFQENEKPNLYIGMAPRYGKTTVMNYFISWGFALNPYCNFIATSYGDDLVKKFSATIRSVVDCDLFRELFNVRISKDTSSKDLWKIQNGGEFRAASLQGVITGFGAGTEDTSKFGGCLLIDDYLKASDYGSQAKKEQVVDIYENTLKSRRNAGLGTPIIIIAQRLAKDDLIGHIKETEPDDWEFLEIKTYDEESGTTIWPEKHSPKEMEQMKKLHSFLYYSQYQQDPIVLGGAVIKTEFFRYYPVNQDMSYSKIFMTGDTASKIKEHNDYSVFCVWGATKTNRLQLLDMIRGKWEAPDLKKEFLRLWARWKVTDFGICSGVYIEDKASGTGLIQDIKRFGGVPIIGWQTPKDKLQRVEDSLDYIASGLVELPVSKDYSFVPELLSECEAFTRDDSHPHDDIVDNLTMAIEIGLARRQISILEVL